MVSFEGRSGLWPQVEEGFVGLNRADVNWRDAKKHQVWPPLVPLTWNVKATRSDCIDFHWKMMICIRP